MVNNGIQSYRKTNVMTADPRRLVLMCYEGAIDNLEIGKRRLLEKDYEGKIKVFIKAQDIITELLCALDSEKGGLIAENLDALYNYMLRRLVPTGSKEDIDAVEEVIGMLRELKSAWEESFGRQEGEIQQKIAGLNSHLMQQASVSY